MKTPIIVTGLVLLFGFANHSLAQEKIAVQPILNAPGGRFVLGQISDQQTEQYMLDTQTGRLWRIVRDADKNMTLQPVLYQADDGTKAPFPSEAHTREPKKQSSEGPGIGFMR